MGLEIKSTQEKSIKIIGTEITLESVYGRIEFAARADGKTLEIAISTYASRDAFKMGASPITTDVQQGNLNVNLEEGEIQSIDTAQIYSQQAYLQLGYNVDII
jgi:hypothetical protein